MHHSRAMTSLMTGATAAIIALTAIALALALHSPLFNSLAREQQIWPLILASSTATLLVMSVLHSNLHELYAALAQAESRAREDARCDPLTLLGNRKFLLEEIERHLSVVPARQGSALLFLDLDHFKRVNDTLGHFAGDELIRQVAERLKTCTPDAIVARLGGDEFALIVSAPDDTQLAACCERICSCLSESYSVGRSEANVGVSIGAAYFDPALDAAGMMRRADIAM